MRPGPGRIAPGAAPGGLVLHAYSIAGELLRVSILANVDEAEDRATVDATAIVRDPRSAAGVILVIFDGDTGDRWGAAWQRRIGPE